MRTVELVAIRSIFSRREEDGQYTNSARTYQNILRYSLFLKQNPRRENDNGKSFSWWSLIDWLTSNKNNNSEDKGTKNRIENPQKTIKKKLQNLVKLKLIYVSESRPGTKRIGTALIYQYTKLGYLLAWIIESFDENCDQKLVQNEIYALVSDIFTIKEYSSSFNIFLSKFFKKCKERNVFGNIIAMFRRGVCEVNLIKMADLFQYIWSLDFAEVKDRIYFNNLFDETINELEPEIQKLVLYALKLNIERKMKDISYNFERFEKKRFGIRKDYDKVALECLCGICKRLVYIKLDLLDYRKRITNSYFELASVILAKCQQCKTDSLIIPNI